MNCTVWVAWPTVTVVCNWPAGAKLELADWLVSITQVPAWGKAMLVSDPPVPATGATVHDPLVVLGSTLNEMAPLPVLWAYRTYGPLGWPGSL